MRSYTKIWWNTVTEYFLIQERYSSGQCLHLLLTDPLCTLSVLYLFSWLINVLLKRLHVWTVFTSPLCLVSIAVPGLCQNYIRYQVWVALSIRSDYCVEWKSNYTLLFLLCMLENLKYCFAKFLSFLFVPLVIEKYNLS